MRTVINQSSSINRSINQSINQYIKQTLGYSASAHRWIL